MLCCSSRLKSQGFFLLLYTLNWSLKVIYNCIKSHTHHYYSDLIDSTSPSCASCLVLSARLRVLSDLLTDTNYSRSLKPSAKLRGGHFHSDSGMSMWPLGHVEQQAAEGCPLVDLIFSALFSTRTHEQLVKQEHWDFSAQCKDFRDSDMSSGIKAVITDDESQLHQESATFIKIHKESFLSLLFMMILIYDMTMEG